MKTISSILFLTYSLGVFAQIKLSKDDLVVKYKEEWSDELEAVYYVPKFKKKQYGLEGKLVEIELYINMVDVMNGYVVGTSFCLDCLDHFDIVPDGELAIELNFQNDNLGVDPKDLHTVQGILRLNTTNTMRMIYIVDDVEIIE